MRQRVNGEDVGTPKTDALIEKMLHETGIPNCPEWDQLVEHAREMERMAYAYRAVASAGMKISRTT